MLTCPNCNNKDPNRIILIPYWRNTHHDFGCGNCKLSMSFKVHPDHPINEQLLGMYDLLLKFDNSEQFEELEEKIENMTLEEKEARLAELNKKKK